MIVKRTDNRQKSHEELLKSLYEGMQKLQKTLEEQTPVLRALSRQYEELQSMLPVTEEEKEEVTCIAITEESIQLIAGKRLLCTYGSANDLPRGCSIPGNVPIILLDDVRKGICNALIRPPAAYRGADMYFHLSIYHEYCNLIIGCKGNTNLLEGSVRIQVTDTHVRVSIQEDTEANNAAKAIAIALLGSGGLTSMITLSALSILQQCLTQTPSQTPAASIPRAVKVESDESDLITGIILGRDTVTAVYGTGEKAKQQTMSVYSDALTYLEKSTGIPAGFLYRVHASVFQFFPCTAYSAELECKEFRIENSGVTLEVLVGKSRHLFRVEWGDKLKCTRFNTVFVPCGVEESIPGESRDSSVACWAFCRALFMAKEWEKVQEVMTGKEKQ